MKHTFASKQLDDNVAFGILGPWIYDESLHGKIVFISYEAFFFF